MAEPPTTCATVEFVLLGLLVLNLIYTALFYLMRS